MTQEIRLGSRASALAIKQAETVIEKLQTKFPNLDILLETFKSEADLKQNVPLTDLSDNTAFTKEIQNALLKGDIDVGVHNAKFLPDEIDPSTEIYSIFPRVECRDILLRKQTLAESPQKIVTTCLRKSIFLQKYYPKAEYFNVRGNVPSRVNRLRKSEFDAVLLSADALRRLDLLNEPDLKYRYFSVDELMPTCCQGIVAIQVKKDSPLRPLIETIVDEQSNLQMIIERLVLKELNCSFKDSLGVRTIINNGNLKIEFNLVRNNLISEGSVEGVVEDYVTLVKKVVLQSRKEYINS